MLYLPSFFVSVGQIWISINISGWNSTQIITGRLTSGAKSSLLFISFYLLYCPMTNVTILTDTNTKPRLWVSRTIRIPFFTSRHAHICLMVFEADPELQAQFVKRTAEIDGSDLIVYVCSFVLSSFCLSFCFAILLFSTRSLVFAHPIPFVGLAWVGVYEALFSLSCSPAARSLRN